MGRGGLFVLTLASGLALSACGTVGGWFDWSGSSTPKVKPAELGEIKATVPLTKAWDANVGGGSPYVFAPATDGKAIYAAGRDGRIVKLDPATGRELWRQESGRTLSAGVGVGEGLVLVGTPKGEVLAFRDGNGEPAWTARLTGEILTAPVAAAGLVAARGNDGKVWLLDAGDGKQRWMYNRSLPALVLREPGSLLLTGQSLFVGFPGGKLTALALGNGAPLWEASVSLPRGATELERISDVAGALAADDRLVCASAYQGRVACFDQENGNTVWARDFSGLTGVELDERFLFAADDRGVVQGFDKLRGASLWRQERLRDRKLSAPLVVAGHVAVADFQGYVHLLKLDEGAIVARSATDGSAVPGRMLALSRGLIVQTANGGVFALRLQ